MPEWAWTLVGVLGGLLLCWLVLMAVLWATCPDELRLRELLRLLPEGRVDDQVVLTSHGRSSAPPAALRRRRWESRRLLTASPGPLRRPPVHDRALRTRWRGIP